MSTNFPSSLDSFTTPNPAGTLSSEHHSTLHINADDAVVALETKVGVNASAVTTSHDYKITTLETTGSNGWTPVTDTWTYASATTVTVPTDATTKYTVGMRVKLTQTTVKYFYITAVAATTLTLNGGSDYTVANAAISAISYSRWERPVGFPAQFHYSPVWGAASGAPSIGNNGSLSGVFRIAADGFCSVSIVLSWGSDTNGGSGEWNFSLPVTALGASVGSARSLDSGTGYNTGSSSLNTTTTMVIYKDGAGAGWQSITPQTWATNDYLNATISYSI